MQPLQVIFMGTGDIGLPSLRWLIDSPGVDLLAVFCQPDKPVGRKQVLTPPSTKVLARSHGIPVRQPQRLRSDSAFFDSSTADIIVVMAYGQLLPKAILNAPRLACINLHASLLPRHRGASPIQAAIREGDTESGVTVMFMDEGLDTGDILLAHRLALAPDETGGTLHDRIAHAAPAALAEAVVLLQLGTAPRQSQDNAIATHCGKLGRADGQINWHLPAAAIERLIRAYEPWPGTTSCLFPQPGASGRSVKLFPPCIAQPQKNHPILPPGTLITRANADLAVQTGNGLLGLQQIQIEGKKRMHVREFLKGNALAPDARMGEKS